MQSSRNVIKYWNRQTVNSRLFTCIHFYKSLIEGLFIHLCVIRSDGLHLLTPTTCCTDVSDLRTMLGHCPWTWIAYTQRFINKMSLGTGSISQLVLEKMEIWRWNLIIPHEQYCPTRRTPGTIHSGDVILIHVHNKCPRTHRDLIATVQWLIW